MLHFCTHQTLITGCYASQCRATEKEATERCAACVELSDISLNPKNSTGEKKSKCYES